MTQEVDYLRKACEKDEMLKPFYEDILDDQQTMTEQEIFCNLRFFFVFAMGYTHMGMTEAAEKMGKRMDTLISILERRGYKRGMRYQENRIHRIRIINLENIINRVANLDVSKYWEE